MSRTQAHVFLQTIPVRTEEVANRVANEKPVVNAVANKSRYRDVERRKEYMREYMRRKRAALKS